MAQNACGTAAGAVRPVGAAWAWQRDRLSARITVSMVEKQVMMLLLFVTETKTAMVMLRVMWIVMLVTVMLMQILMVG